MEMDPEQNKNAVYMARAVEAVNEDGGELQRRDFGPIGLLGLACTVTCVYTTVLTTLATCLVSGGPVLILWGFLFAGMGAMLIALSLGELASAFPTSRGPMQWAYECASIKTRRFISYFVGHLNWMGFSVISGGFSVLIGQQVMGLAVIFHPDLIVKQWMVWLVAEAILFLTTLVNIYAMPIMPIIEKSSLWFFLFTYVCYLIVPIACARAFNGTLQTPSFVFTTFYNRTGWEDFTAFMIGLTGVTASFGGTDGVAHVSEECEFPERDVPRTMWLTVVVGLVTTFTVFISLLYAVVDVDSILASPTGMPYIQLVYNAVQSKAGTACLVAPVIVITSLGLLGAELACSRTAFAVARDGGFFTKSYFARLSPSLNVPIRAIWATTAVSACLLCTYLGSTYALSSFLQSVMLLNWIVYSICLITLLLCGRQYAAPGPFQLGRAGWFINIAALVYMIFQGVFFLLPYSLPVEYTSMNYSAVVVTGLMLIVLVAWFITGQRDYLSTPIASELHSHSTPSEKDFKAM